MVLLEPDGLTVVRAGSQAQSASIRRNVAAMSVPLAGNLEAQPLELNDLFLGIGHRDLVLSIVCLGEVRQDRSGFPSSAGLISKSKRATRC